MKRYIFTFMTFFSTTIVFSSEIIESNIATHPRNCFNNSEYVILAYKELRKNTEENLVSELGKLPLLLEEFVEQKKLLLYSNTDLSAFGEIINVLDSREKDWQQNLEILQQKSSYFEKWLVFFQKESETVDSHFSNKKGHRIQKILEKINALLEKKDQEYYSESIKLEEVSYNVFQTYKRNSPKIIEILSQLINLLKKITQTHRIGQISSDSLLFRSFSYIHGEYLLYTQLNNEITEKNDKLKTSKEINTLFSENFTGFLYNHLLKEGLLFKKGHAAQIQAEKPKLSISLYEYVDV